MATDTKPKKESFRKMTTVHQTPREWESVETNIDKMLEYVSQNNLLKDPYIKLYNGKPILTVRPGSSKNSFILEVLSENNLNSDREIILYKYAREKYFELVFERLSSKEKAHVCTLRQIKIARQTRRTERFITDKNPVHAGNFLVAKIDLDIKSALGFSTEVIFNEVDKTLKAKYPRSKIVPLFNRYDLKEEEELVRKHKVPIFITNTSKMESYKEIETFDLKTHYEEEFMLDEKVAFFRKEMIQSFLYYPIIFKSATEEVVIGYCYNESQTPITQGNLEYFEIIAYTIKKRIMDSSTASVDVKQNIVNVSEHGVLIEVTSDYIFQAIKTKPSFSMDIVFKMSVPMRFSLYAKHIYQIEDTYYIGAEITGSNNEEKGFDKYKDIVRAFK
ncbi:MAG TPA: DUF1577 domain-containing protein [Leptospiraceae bacterium]|nr:DUF1577 domain-containing protein [Leptospiraceae bacterium]HMX31356.1 DUF1577 domain-containing protein [Leptospiraceae bacterium]HMY31601.1 DUF1577 domain-containing protein [Leptospiraceae bacterium]HMZ66123.1 DUF1577 domain-containing protein [Leptospiraceae bacterium]HNA09678.1 DUF1577 domain-containing protein [Leptospiraceae bacterium]